LDYISGHVGICSCDVLHFSPRIIGLFESLFTSDATTVHIGKYASEHAESMIDGALSWKSIASLVIGLILISPLLFIDWRILIQKKKFQLKFKIWK